LVAKLRRKSKSNGQLGTLVSESEETLSAFLAAESGKKI
jgi:hypothetical protein